MDTNEAAQVLGVAPHEVTDVRAEAGWWEAHHHDMASHEETWRKVAQVTTEEHAALIAEAEADPDGPGVDVDGDGVPEGSARQVLEWVGSDQARAEQALTAERAKDTPRVTLVAALEKLAG